MKVDFRAAFGQRDVILLTLDALRYDVAAAALAEGRTPHLAALVGAMQMLTGAPEIIMFTWLIAAALAPFGSAVRLVRIDHGGEARARNAAIRACRSGSTEPRKCRSRRYSPGIVTSASQLKRQCPIPYPSTAPHKFVKMS